MDAGLNVDEDMVTALMQEVILENAASMLGQRDTETALPAPARRRVVESQSEDESVVVQGVSGRYQQRQRRDEEEVKTRLNPECYHV